MWINPRQRKGKNPREYHQKIDQLESLIYKNMLLRKNPRIRAPEAKVDVDQDLTRNVNPKNLLKATKNSVPKPIIKQEGKRKCKIIPIIRKK